MVQRSQALINLLLLAGCTNTSPWIVSAIAAGDALFDSSRLRFLSLEAYPPLTVEMVKFSDRIETFITLNRFRFSSNPVPVKLSYEGEIFEDLALLYEGAMRLKLSQESTYILIQALQEGHEVAIVVDGFVEKLDPNQFPEGYSRFIRGGQFNFLKGPVE